MQRTATAETFRPRAQKQTGRSLTDLIDWFDTMLSLRRQRLDLRALTDLELKDIGLSRYEAEREGRRLPWDWPTQP